MKAAILTSSLACLFLASLPSSGAESAISSLWPLPEEAAKFDANNDRILTGEELSGPAARYDLNGDGLATPAEVIHYRSMRNFKKEHPDYAEPKFAPQKIVRAPGRKFENAILISMDGLDRRVLMELIGSGRVPNLLRIADSSGPNRLIINSTIPDYQTETKPGHAVMLTSLIPEHTRVLTNSRFQPIPEGLTIFERVKAATGGRVKTVFVSSKRENVGAMTAGELGGRSECGIPIEGGPYLNAKKSIDVFSAEDRDEDAAKDAFLDALKEVKGGPFLAFLHFRNPDRSGHASGRESDAYRAGCERADRCIGEILDALKAEGLLERTRIFATADHGFVPGARGHYYAPWIALITNDHSIFTNETIRSYDVPATIMAGFGVDLESLKPAVSGRDLKNPEACQ